MIPLSVFRYFTLSFMCIFFHFFCTFLLFFFFFFGEEQDHWMREGRKAKMMSPRTDSC